LLVPGSVSQAPGGNFAAPRHIVRHVVKKKVKVKRRKRLKATRLRGGKTVVGRR
jgi:hypothetical protein